MSKAFKIVPSTSTDGSSITPEKSDLNWSICVLCQSQKQEPIVVPGRGKWATKGMGYGTLARELCDARDAGFNPLKVHFDRLDDGSGIEQTLRVHQACWHKLCKNEYSQLKLDRWRKRRAPSDDTPEVSPCKTRRESKAGEKDTCLFCDGIEGDLHTASTFAIDHTVRQYAIQLKDTSLLRKIAGGDLGAIEAKYHKSCMTKLFHDARSAQKCREEADLSSFDGIALAELSAHIDEASQLQGTAPVFRLADLAETYRQRLVDLGMPPETHVNRTRLKERLLLNSPHLTATKHGREILIAVDRDIGDAVVRACTTDSDTMCLAKAASIVRRQIFKNDYTFDGNIGRQDQMKSVPSTLLAFVSMLLQGPNIKDQLNRRNLHRNAALAIAQLLVFNCVKHASLGDHVRHNKSQETPLPIYIGMKVHSETRKRELVDRLHGLGLSISYDRLLRMSSGVANRLCTQYEKDGVVCPPQLRKSIFTTGQADNIDHNPSSVSAKDSFHGTAHSLCQHPHETTSGRNRSNASLFEDESSQTKHVQQLPTNYTAIPAAQALPKVAYVPIYYGPFRPSTDEGPDLSVDRKQEYMWLEHQMAICQETTQLCAADNASWAAYHANSQEDLQTMQTNISLLPFFREKSTSVAMISHIMHNNAATTEFLNPGQTPVLTMDQPLYALAKQLQWRFPNIFGEDKYVIMLGGLHTQMAALRTIGDLLDGSGWTDALTQADIASVGTCEGFLRASHVTKTRRAHQVTAAALYQLQQKAFMQSKEIESSDSHKIGGFTEWCIERSDMYPQFNFWQTVLNFELTIFQFVRSLRVSNFDMYIASLAELIPWFFALDHPNYARWLPVHEFKRGAFTAKKTCRHFSAISLDQAHEQMNALVKGDGGAVGLTENPGALRRWMIAGPEIARLVDEFEDGSNENRTTPDIVPPDRHHEQTKSVQEKFVHDVQTLVATIEEMGNPFMEESMDLLNLNSKAVMPEDVVNDLKNIYLLGKAKYNQFMEERFTSNLKSIGDTVPRNNLAMFSKPCTKKTKVAGRLTELKNERAVFKAVYCKSNKRRGC